MTPKLKRFLRKTAGGIPYISSLIRQRDGLRKDVRDLRGENRRLRREATSAAKTLAAQKTWVPPGHFYSPIPSTEDVANRREEIFDRTARELPGIELNESAQLSLLDELSKYYGLIHRERLGRAIPLTLNNPGGSLWMRRVEA